MKMKARTRSAADGAGLIEIVLALGILGILLPGVGMLTATGMDLSRQAARETTWQLLTDAVSQWLREPARFRDGRETVLLFDRSGRMLEAAADRAVWKAVLTSAPCPGWQSPSLQCVQVRFFSAAGGPEQSSAVLQRAISIP